MTVPAGSVLGTVVDPDTDAASVASAVAVSVLEVRFASMLDDPVYKPFVTIAFAVAVVDELPYCIEKDTEVGSFRPDINILINGMPLAFLEVKKPNNDGGIQKEFDRKEYERL